MEHISPAKLSRKLNIPSKELTPYLLHVGIYVRTPLSSRTLSSWFVKRGYGHNVITSSHKVRREFTPEGVAYIRGLLSNR